VRTRGDRRRVLLVDNYDSYIGNLFQLLWCETGVRPDIVESDRMDLEEVERARYSHIILGPGPGTPHNPRDVGASVELLTRTDAAVLGVCFGLQTIAVALGGRVVRSPEPAHGMISTVSREDSLLFAGLPDELEVVRYHSLVVENPLPQGMRATAWTSDGVLMAAEAPTMSLYGVQFHPESIGTPNGADIITNFLGIDAPGGQRHGFYPAQRVVGHV
jgi:anthranilate synthase/aminodeoxychorismate synthase-like glutamine amidotransferase